MALQASGPISFSQLQAEFGGANPISLSEYYRGGSYVTGNNTNVPTSGQVRAGNFYGAVKQFAFTIASNYSTPQNLRTLAIAAGWNQSDYLLVTNNAIISSNTTGSAALTISGSFPNGVAFVNNGYVVGMGGNGGNYGQAGGAGGVALSVQSAASVTNNGVLAGGGGGGGSSPVFGWSGVDLTYGGGAGASGLTAAPGGDGNEWRDGSASSFDSASGTYKNPGVGGYACWAGVCNGPSGNGGAWGAAGGTGGHAGGAGGASVSGNANVTWSTTGTRYGALT